jgi:hypothetical protein
MEVVASRRRADTQTEEAMVLSRQLRQLSKLQSFDNRMDTLYKEGLPPEDSGRKLGTKQRAFLRERNTMVRKLDGTLLRRYERMRQSRVKGNAIVPVVRGVCQGCYMVVTKSLLAQLMEGSALITCEHCGRILYVE